MTASSGESLPQKDQQAGTNALEATAHKDIPMSNNIYDKVCQLYQQRIDKAQMLRVFL